MGATLDVLSGGRFILGLGAGWYAEEYEAYGYPFRLPANASGAFSPVRALQIRMRSSQ